jgi:serine/threonine protein kinase
VQVGSQGKYRLERLLATGGMGEVYLGEVQGEAGFSKPVVIKRLHANLSADDEFVQMLIDEARITSQLFHTNICQVMDLGVAEESYFIAMEYIDGLDLSALGKRAGERFDLDAAIFIASEILAGLHYAHQRTDVDGQPFNIVHRDISPQNILISFEGEVKIIDFGIAKARNRLVKTETGVIKGKYLYMSPEQALGKQVDHRTDIYSMGVVLHDLLLGRSPLLRLPHPEMMRRIIAPKVEPLHRQRSDVPRGLTRVLRKALKRDPGDRYDSALMFQAALQEWGAPYTRTDLARYVLTLFPEHATARRDLTVHDDVDPRGDTVSDAAPDENTVATRQPFHETEPARWTQVIEARHRDLQPVISWDPTRREDLGQTLEEPPRRRARSEMGTPRSGQQGREDPQLQLGSGAGDPYVAHAVVEPPILPRPRRDLRPDDEELAEAVRARGNGSGRLFMVVVGLVLLGAGLLIGRFAYQPVEAPRPVAANSPRDAAGAAVDLPGPEPPDASQPRTIAVRSRPAGARIKLCGRALRVTTPARVRLRVERRCKLELELEGYRPFRTVVRPTTLALDIRLKRRPAAGPPPPPSKREPPAIDEGKLRVVSIHEAVVYINGREAGLAPGFERKLPAGRYRVRVYFTALERYSSMRTVTIRAGETTSVRFGQ